MAETEQLNILIEAGTDFILPFTIYDDNGSPLDLTGATVTARLREYAEASDYFDFTCAHTDTGGRITISMSHETTALIPYSRGVYETKLTLSNGQIFKPLKGEVFIEPNAI